MPWALETAEHDRLHSPSAVQAVKQQISATIAEHARSREALDQELGDRVRASAHFKEGVAAFLEKRRRSTKGSSAVQRRRGGVRTWQARRRVEEQRRFLGLREVEHVVERPREPCRTRSR